MKIAVYSSKGSAGKTPISTNIALDKDFCIGTNEAFHVYDSFIPDNQLIALNTEEAFPEELEEHDIADTSTAEISMTSPAVPFVAGRIYRIVSVSAGAWNEVK